MIICKKCNKQLADGTKFCYHCGTEVTDVLYCKQCGKPISSNFVFCQNCGAPVTEKAETLVTTSASLPNPAKPTPPPLPNPASSSISPQTPVYNPMPMPAPVSQTTGSIKKKASSRLPKILISAAAAVLIIILAIVGPKILSKLNSTPKGLLYLKDNELSYTSLSKIKPKEITENLYKDGSIEPEDASSVSYMVAISEDGKRLFYPDEVTDEDEGVTLYYRNINSKKEGEKIDSDVLLYKVNSAGNKVLYIKGSGHDLYMNDLTDKEKIENDVNNFYATSNFNKILYITTEGTIYLKAGKKDSEKLDSNSNIVYVSDDLETIYYLKDGSLYIKKGTKDKEKIDSDVSDVIKVYASGEIYYLKSEETQVNLSDFVNDDKKETDATMTEPVEPAYPDYYDYQPADYPVEPYYYEYSDAWGYTDWEAYTAAYDLFTTKVDEYNQEWNAAYDAAVDTYNQDNTAYQDALTEYYAKQDRDNLRESIIGQTITSSNNILYYYDTKDSVKITDTYSSYLDYSYEKPVIVYENYDKKEITKVNLSEVTSYDDIYNRATEAMNSSTKVFIAIEASAAVVDQNSGSYYSLKPSGEGLYYLDNYDFTEGYGDLYKAEIKDNKLEAAKKIEEAVNSFSLIGEKGTLVYYKDVKESTGDLYKDKKLIDSDVYIYTVNQLGTSDNLIYYVDYDYDSEQGTLKLYKDKETIKLGDDIHYYYAFSDKRIVYLKDYNLERNKGDLYLYNGSDKKKTIDTDVTTIIPIYDGGYRGSLGYENE